jgi:hypothetical protein
MDCGASAYRKGKCTGRTMSREDLLLPKKKKTRCFLLREGKDFSARPQVNGHAAAWSRHATFAKSCRPRGLPFLSRRALLARSWSLSQMLHCSGETLTYSKLSVHASPLWFVIGQRRQDTAGKNTNARTSMLSRGGAPGASGFSNDVWNDSRARPSLALSWIRINSASSVCISEK